MDIGAVMEQLLERPVYVIDFLPMRVGENGHGQFYEIEDYWYGSNLSKEIYRKFLRILLKLNCYYDMDVVRDGNNANRVHNPEPGDFVRWVAGCTMGEQKGYLNILLNGDAAMILLNGDDLSLSVYGPEETLCNLLGQLAAAEGLFFWKSEGV